MLVEECFYYNECPEPGTHKLMLDRKSPVFYCGKHYAIVKKLLLAQLRD